MLKIAVVSFLLDYIFLSMIKPFSTAMIYKIQGSPLRINYIAAAVVYMIVVFQIHYFIILQKASLLHAFLLGSSTYGLFEFTNMSLFKHWNYKLALLDTLWGGVLYSLTTYIIRI